MRRGFFSELDSRTCLRLVLENYNSLKKSFSMRLVDSNMRFGDNAEVSAYRIEIHVAEGFLL